MTEYKILYLSGLIGAAIGWLLLRQFRRRKQAEDIYRNLFDNANDAIFIFNLTGRLLKVNKAACTRLGYTSEELLQMSPKDIDAPEYADKVPARMEEILHESRLIFETAHIRKDGSSVPIEMSCSVIMYQGQKAFLCYARDISKRRHAENELRMFKSVIESSGEAIAISDPQGRLIYINPAHEQLFGRSFEEAKSVDYRDYYPPESLEIMNRVVMPALARCESWEGELDVFDAEGRCFPLWERAGSTCNADGKMMFAFGFMHDVSGRRQIEKNLNNAIRYNRSLIEASIDPLVTIDPAGKISDVNAATEKITGYSRTELIGTDFSDYFTEPEKARIGYRQVFENGTVRDYFLEIRHRDGHVTPVLYNASVYRDEHENVIGVFAAARDITERIRAEEQIRASLSEKEVLLREIHHRVKNNMQVITSLLRLQSKQIKDRQILELFRESHTRISAMALIHETLYQSPELARIDFRHYSDKLMKSLFQIYGAKIGQIRLLIDVGDISLDIDQAIPLGLIINELVSNALKYAFPEKTHGEIKLALCRKDDDRIELCVSDNGIGIPPESDIRNMDSLGLRLVFDLVERQLQGRVEVIRTEGTRFVITFKEHG